MKLSVIFYFMKRTIPLLVMLAVAVPALAEEATTNLATTSRQNGRKEVREETREKIREIREDIKTTREDTREMIKDKRVDIKMNFKDAKEDIKMDSKEALEKMVERRKEALKKIEQEKKDLKVKLAKVKDTKKREAVERINENIAKLNKEKTDNYTEVLIKISAILLRVEERINKAESVGLNVTDAKTALADAGKAIEDANTAVNTQAEKVYILSVTDETTLKQKVGETRQLLKNDLSSVYGMMKKAKEAVRNTATTLAKIDRVEEIPEVVPPVATTTVNQ